jgi:UDP-2,4-diacetamido-2,4,6-trideoxy-beta-L-altropyranose hydrolase
MRCLSFADHLTALGGSATFVSLSMPASYREALDNRHHCLLELAGGTGSKSHPTGPNLAHAAWLPWSQHEDAERCSNLVKGKRFTWLIVDHYALASDWEIAMRQLAHRLMVIDDLADRDHCCDLLLDQNFGRKTSHYESRVPPNCRLLLGPQYALLRPEFGERRGAALARRRLTVAPSLLVSLGGVDKDNYTTRVLHSLAGANLPRDTSIVVVLGAEAPHIAEVKAEAARSPWRTEVIVNATDVARLMSEATWAIGAAGTSLWERCCLGLPTLTLVVADNQLAAARALSEEGYVVLADPSVTHVDSILMGMEKLIANAQQLSQRCAQITDGCGVDRTLQSMVEMSSNGR